LPDPFSDLVDRLVAVFRPRGRRLLEEALRVKSELHVLDPDVIHDMLASAVIEEFESVKGRKSAETLARALEEASNALKVPGSARAILDMARLVAERVSRGDVEAEEAYKMLLDGYQQFKIDLEASIDNAAAEVERLLGVAGPSEVATINYATTLYRVLLTSRSNISRLTVVDLAPIYSGRRLAVSLRKRKVNAYYMPDVEVSWAARKSEAVVIYALGGSEGMILGDMGAYTLAAAAKAYDVPVIVVAPEFNFYGADEALDVESYKVSLARYGSLYNVDADPVELLDYDLVDHLVTGSTVYSPPAREDLLGLASSLKEVLLRYIYLD